MARVGDIEHGFRAVSNVDPSQDREYIRSVKNRGGIVKMIALETDKCTSKELTKMGMISVWLPVEKEGE